MPAPTTSMPHSTRRSSQRNKSIKRKKSIQIEMEDVKLCLQVMRSSIKKKSNESAKNATRNHKKV